jgi:membrane-associated protein
VAAPHPTTGGPTTSARSAASTNVCDTVHDSIAAACTLGAMLDLLLHVDKHLATLVASAGPWTYVLLFAVIFAETGLVILPFLPGDSLLFAAGALAATGLLRLDLLFVVLTVAAVLGDAVNYSVGKRLAHHFLDPRPAATPSTLARLVKPAHVAKAHAFFLTHGGKAVVLARFVPIVRTFLPFVAGGADMPYGTFAVYNVSGGALWVALCAGAGYAFGNIPVVKENFELVILGIVFVSVLPMIIEVLRMGREVKA